VSQCLDLLVGDDRCPAAKEIAMPLLPGAQR
jgi:hypothetical protein